MAQRVRKANRAARKLSEDRSKLVSNGVPADILQRFEEVVANASTSRQEWFRKVFDRRRGLEDECGYEFVHSPWSAHDYKEFFDRFSMTRRVCECLPKECWQVSPEVYEDEDAEVTTPFEKAWDELATSLNGGSRYKTEKGNPVWEYLQRVDVLSGIGHYGVLLLGLDDGRPLDTPCFKPDYVSTEEEGFLSREGADRFYGVTRDFRPGNLVEGEDAAGLPGREPKKSRKQGAGEGGQTASTSEYANGDGASDRPTKSRKLLYLRAFSEDLAPILRSETDPTSPRYGMPVSYQITFHDPKSGSGATNQDTGSKEVHWTRVVHVADNLLSNEVFGEPRPKLVLTHLLDLYKVYGSSAEMYYKGAFPGWSLETHPQLGGDVDVDRPAMKDMMEQYFNSLQRYLALEGMTAKSLAPQVVDPTPQIQVQLQAISVELAIPLRILCGSERGELASSQDDGKWNDVLRGRQNGHLTPRLVVPLVDRLIKVGVLPEPEQYYCDWPDLDAQTESEKAATALTKTQALVAYAGGGGDSIVPPLDFLVTFLGFSEDEAQAVLDNAEKIARGESDSSSQSPLLSLVGGITGVIELFKLAKDGGLSEEQLKQLLMLFFKVDEEKATQILADGITATAEEAGMGMEAEVEKEATMVEEGLKADPVEAQEAKIEADKQKVKALAKGKNPFGGGKAKKGGPPQFSANRKTRQGKIRA